jgi:hypothetical protein
MSALDFTAGMHNSNDLPGYKTRMTHHIPKRFYGVDVIFFPIFTFAGFNRKDLMPLARHSRNVHKRDSLPSKSTVQAPHSASVQPIFVPVNQLFSTQLPASHPEPLQLKPLTINSKSSFIFFFIFFSKPRFTHDQKYAHKQTAAYLRLDTAEVPTIFCCASLRLV